MPLARRPPKRQPVSFLKDGDLYFAFELARELRIEDPVAMLKRMPTKRFMMWRAFHKAEAILAEQARKKAASG